MIGRDRRVYGAEVQSAIGYVPEGHDPGYPWMTVGRLIEHHRVFFPGGWLV